MSYIQFWLLLIHCFVLYFSTADKFRGVARIFQSGGGGGGGHTSKSHETKIYKWQKIWDQLFVWAEHSELKSQ